MMRLVCDMDSGWPNDLTPGLQRRVAALKGHTCAFKIGITNCPEERMREYERSNPGYYSEMRVIYRTSSRRNAVELEKRLIERNWFDEKFEGKIAGGGGRKGKGEYYLYVVRV